LFNFEVCTFLAVVAPSAEFRGHSCFTGILRGHSHFAKLRPPKFGDIASAIGKYLRSMTPNPYTTHSFRLSMHTLSVHINRMCTLHGKHHVVVGLNTDRTARRHSRSWCACAVVLCGRRADTVRRLHEDRKQDKLI